MNKVRETVWGIAYLHTYTIGETIEVHIKMTINWSVYVSIICDNVICDDVN